MTTPTDRAIEAAREWKAARDALSAEHPRTLQANKRVTAAQQKLDAALDAAPDDDGGWQDIATCPVYSSGLKVLICGGRHTEPEIAAADGAWWRSSDCPQKSRPTHWRPLPAPPSQESRK